ncbi:MAG: hypothetical protein LBP74_04530 [Treponema sp.]|jgi:hypothetical protein|nr:hypothetical protein [Treponema sp.]
MKRTIPLFFVLAAIMGCTSTRASVPPPSPIAAEYRETQAEVQQQQAELAITGTKIEAESRAIAGDIAKLEASIAAAPPDFGEAERLAWLSQAQALRERAEGHQAEAEKLNRQLAEEREINGRMTRQFNEYEVVQLEALTERDTEISALKIENKAVKGQRNLYLAMFIALCLGVLGYIAFRVFRFLRIIPI